MNLKTLLLLFILSGIIHKVKGCNVCGCAPSAGFTGILPRYDYSFAGVRFQYRLLNTTHPPLFESLPPEKFTDHFYTLEVWSKILINNRWNLILSLPYHQFKMVGKTDHHPTNYGFGDASAIALYTILNTGDSLDFAVKQALVGGFGVKAPTGRWPSGSSNDISLPVNMQLGTGSVDFPLMCMYTLRYKKAGLNAEASYRINTANKEGYHFGNPGMVAARFFTWKRIGKATLLPNVGVYTEWWARDRQHNKLPQDPTGGYVTGFTGGMDVFTGNWSFGATLRLPAKQQIAEGIVKQRLHFSFQTIFLF
jgi:hypothetical protein